MSRSPWREEGPVCLLGDPPTLRQIHQHPWGVLCPTSSLLRETGTGGTHRLWSNLPMSGRGKPRCVCCEDDTLLASLLPTLHPLLPAGKTGRGAHQDLKHTRRLPTTSDFTPTTVPASHSSLSAHIASSNKMSRKLRLPVLPKYR